MHEISRTTEITFIAIPWSATSKATLQSFDTRLLTRDSA
jgi:hypothetical protein